MTFGLLQSYRQRWLGEELQRHRVILFQAGNELIAQPGGLPDKVTLSKAVGLSGMRFLFPETLNFYQLRQVFLLSKLSLTDKG